jgi:hypothetical protein
MNVHLISESMDIDKLPKYKENLSGIGGSISTYFIEDASLIIGSTQLDIPVMVGRRNSDSNIRH